MRLTIDASVIHAEEAVIRARRASAEADRDLAGFNDDRPGQTVAANTLRICDELQGQLDRIKAALR